ncbi:putative aquaporin NIP-type [Canna indica]|uniref:Aquaporin NIP-type n=1 Tax=Canna indica TaxID=4628 RepID=A0AAQ3JPD0_9LILI|nr:putative aquaporin NIP-type [Canna indica]
MASIDEEITRLEEATTGDDSILCSAAVVNITQKLIAEGIGTFFVVFGGCGSVVVNKMYGSVTFPGICVVWGLIVMVMVYSVGHISGAHFNPAVTITFTVLKHFPWKQMPLYIVAQLLGSILASGVLCLLFNPKPEHFYGTTPVGSAVQSFILEIIISYLLMFVISGVATDSRAIGALAGIAVGSTILLNILIAGPLIFRHASQKSVGMRAQHTSQNASRVWARIPNSSTHPDGLLAGVAEDERPAHTICMSRPLIQVLSASMNPARSIGPAILMHNFKSIWAYILGPIIGTLAGGLTYNLVRYTDKPVREITQSGSFLKSKTRH